MLRNETQPDGEQLRALIAAGHAFDLALSAVVERRMKAAGLTYRDLAGLAGMGETTFWNRLSVGGFTGSEKYRVAIVLDSNVSTLDREAEQDIAAHSEAVA